MNRIKCKGPLIWILSGENRKRKGMSLKMSFISRLLAKKRKCKGAALSKYSVNANNSSLRAMSECFRDHTSTQSNDFVQNDHFPILAYAGDHLV